MFPKSVNLDNHLLQTTVPSREKTQASPTASTSVPVATQSHDDEVNLSDFHPSKARKLLNERIITALNSVLENSGIGPVQTAKADDFTPDKVADRILSFIDSAMSLAKLNGASEKDLDKMYAQAKKGVEQGFNEARDILRGFGVLNGKIADDINSTWDKIQQGFAEREAAKAAPVATSATSNLVAARSAAEVSASRSESFSLELKTREGDVIKLTIENQQSFNAAMTQSRSDKGEVTVLSASQSSRSGVAYSVEGDINDAELQAINAFLQDVDALADQFYSGNLQEALQQASQLGFDSKQIASFRIDMSMTETRSAVPAYEQVSQLDRPEAAQTSMPKPLTASQTGLIKDFMDRSEAVLRAAESLFPKPDQKVKDLFEGISRITERYRNFNENMANTEKLPFNFGEIIEGLEQVRAEQVTD